MDDNEAILRVVRTLVLGAICLAVTIGGCVCGERKIAADAEANVPPWYKQQKQETEEFYRRWQHSSSTSRPQLLELRRIQLIDNAVRYQAALQMMKIKQGNPDTEFTIDLDAAAGGIEAELETELEKLRQASKPPPDE